MYVLAVKSQVESLPDWVLAFLDAAWSHPNENGQRAALRFSDALHPAVNRFTSMMEKEMAEPGAVSHVFGYGLWGGAKQIEDMKIQPIILYKQWHLSVAAKIVEAWNERATLAECVVCGSLMRPGKGRQARTCSDACRLKLHREGRKA